MPTSTCRSATGRTACTSPAGRQDEEYRLTAEAYVDLIPAFCAALGLERPVVLGCSIGGTIVLELARAHPERFRALIGLEAGAYQPPWYDDTGWLHRPDVHGGEGAGALMSALQFRRYLLPVLDEIRAASG